MQNKEAITRAMDHADRAVALYGDEDRQVAVQDLMSDLRHFCKVHHIDAEELWERSLFNFMAEAEGN